MRYTISLGLTSLLASGAALAEVPQVVTDIHPVHALVSAVMGDLGQPALLLAAGANEHSFQLRPSQAASLQDADVVFWIGPALTPWLDRALTSVPEQVGRVALLQAAGTLTQDYGAEQGHDHAAEKADAHGHDDHATAEGHAHDAAEEAGHDHEGHAHDSHDHEGHDAAHEDEHAHEAGHDHAHTGVDPHAWLAPENAVVWLNVIAAELALRDPANAATYSANAAAAAADIAALDAEAAAVLAPVADRPIIVFHEAFGYYAAHYGLTIAGSVAAGDAATPGAARIAALRETVVQGGAACVFPEVQHDPALLQQIVEGTGAQTGGALDPVGSSLEPGAGLYRALILGMATTIADCLRGA
jgi:zinc transport system substrate-binding protein